MIQLQVCPFNGVWFQSHNAPQDLDYVILVKSLLMIVRTLCLQEDLWKVCSATPLMLARGFWLQLLKLFSAKYTIYFAEKNMFRTTMCSKFNFDICKSVAKFLQKSFWRDFFSFVCVHFIRWCSDALVHGQAAGFPSMWTVGVEESGIIAQDALIIVNSSEILSHCAPLFSVFCKYKEIFLKLGHFWNLLKTRKNKAGLQVP